MCQIIYLDRDWCFKHPNSDSAIVALFQFLVAGVVVCCSDEGGEQRVPVFWVPDSSADADVDALTGVVW